MIRNFTTLFYISFFMFLSTSFIFAIETETVCFSDENKTENRKDFCQQIADKNFLIEENLTIADKIFFIQESIREEIDEGKRLILVAEGFTATLMSIAQENMLLYYREEIKGLVLKDAKANYYNLCKQTLFTSPTCKEIKAFQRNLLGKASEDEVLKALSPSYQFDLYTPKVILVDENRTTLQEWEKILNESNICYEKVHKIDNKLKKLFDLKRSCKIQPHKFKSKPNFFGAILHYHLWKISYKNKNNLTVMKNISYGTDELQKYDIYYKKASSHNPLLIYIHGGGWTQGDKAYFNDFAKQYADKGFTAISVNYRLMNLPKIGMKEMVYDVKNAIEHILNNAKEYHADSNNTIIMAESAGAQLAFMAITKLQEPHPIKVAIFNSITTDLRMHPLAKQIRLSGIIDNDQREAWLDAYSPFNNLMNYRVKTLGIHSLDDRIVPLKHLKKLEIYSVINHNNIHSLWIKNASHPITPKKKTIYPSFIEIDESVNSFIKKNIK